MKKKVSGAVSISKIGECNHLVITLPEEIPESEKVVIIKNNSKKTITVNRRLKQISFPRSIFEFPRYIRVGAIVEKIGSPGDARRGVIISLNHELKRVRVAWYKNSNGDPMKLRSWVNYETLCSVR